MKREKITTESIDIALNEIVGALQKALKKKGDGTFASSHEILGALTEEYIEVIDAVKNNGSGLKAELLDVAVVCLFGIACINQETMDW
jgi:NTP pyrophosphatase (non-canonical NTP hydrolase)